MTTTPQPPLTDAELDEMQALCSAAIDAPDSFEMAYRIVRDDMPRLIAEFRALRGDMITDLRRQLAEKDAEIAKIKNKAVDMVKFAIRAHEDIQENGGSYTYDGLVSGFYCIQVKDEP